MSWSQLMVPLETWSFFRSLSVPSRDMLSYNGQGKGGGRGERSALRGKQIPHAITYEWNEKQSNHRNAEFLYREIIEI